MQNWVGNVMNWDVIGATGEWAGAIGVIATLVYLAGQLKQMSIDLDRYYMACLAGQQCCQRTGSGTDFQHLFVAAQLCCLTHEGDGKWL